MQRLDLVLQARAYVEQAKQTASRPRKARLLKVAQRLMGMSVEDTAGITFVSPFDPRCPRVLGAVVRVGRLNTPQRPTSPMT